MASTRDVRRLFVRCALLGMIAALPVAFNAWIDPARILGSPTDERAIAAALLIGKNVTNVVNYDDRAIERILAAGRSSPDVLALGSSRIQVLSAEAFPAQRFINAGTAGARLDDVLAIYTLYDDPVRRPKRIVLNLDPWSIQEPPGTDLTWGSLARERAEMLDRVGTPTSLWRDRVSLSLSSFKRLASPEYFRLSVFSLRHHGTEGIRFVTSDRRVNAEKTKTPDGTLVWPPQVPEKAEHTVDTYIAALPTDSRYHHLEPRALQHQLETLERFLRYVRDQGVEVTLLLAPYHPRAFAAMDSMPERPLVWTEAQYRALAQRVGAQVVGGYDPRPLGIQGTDFFDESHMRPEALVRLFRH